MPRPTSNYTGRVKANSPSGSLVSNHQQGHSVPLHAPSQVPICQRLQVNNDNYKQTTWFILSTTTYSHAEQHIVSKNAHPPSLPSLTLPALRELLDLMMPNSRHQRLLASFILHLSLHFIYLGFTSCSPPKATSRTLQALCLELKWSILVSRNMEKPPDLHLSCKQDFWSEPNALFHESRCIAYTVLWYGGGIGWV